MVPRGISIPQTMRVLRVSRDETGWRIWLHANADFTLGTFIHLHDADMLITRVTIHEDGTESTFIIEGSNT